MYLRVLPQRTVARRFAWRKAQQALSVRKRCCAQYSKLLGSDRVPEKIGKRGLCAGLSKENQAMAPISSGSPSRTWMICE